MYMALSVPQTAGVAAGVRQVFIGIFPSSKTVITGAVNWAEVDDAYDFASRLLLQARLPPPAERARREGLPPPRRLVGYSPAPQLRHSGTPLLRPPALRPALLCTHPRAARPPCAAELRDHPQAHR